MDCDNEQEVGSQPLTVNMSDKRYTYKTHATDKSCNGVHNYVW